MRAVLVALAVSLVTLLRSRASPHLEVLALRHQLAVLQGGGRHPRPKPADRLLWVWLSRAWSGRQDVLVFVKPSTVISWQRKRFRDHWTQLSRAGTPGRPCIALEIRDLIRKMSRANPSWGSPRIQSELRKLGIDVAKSTVEKYRVRPRRPPSPTWRAFLANHTKELVSLEFFTVATVRFQVLFVLILLAHDRRRVVHFNISKHPTARYLMSASPANSKTTFHYHRWRCHQSLNMDSLSPGLCSRRRSARSLRSARPAACTGNTSEQLPETRSPCDDAQAEQNEDPRTGLRDRNEEVHAESRGSSVVVTL